MSGRSFIYNINSKGPRTDPCGTPLSTSHQLELLSPFNYTLLSTDQKGTDPVNQLATKAIGSELMDKFEIRDFIERLHEFGVKNVQFTVFV